MGDLALSMGMDKSFAKTDLIKGVEFAKRTSDSLIKAATMNNLGNYHAILFHKSRLNDELLNVYSDALNHCDNNSNEMKLTILMNMARISLNTDTLKLNSNIIDIFDHANSIISDLPDEYYKAWILISFYKMVHKLSHQTEFTNVYFNTNIELLINAKEIALQLKNAKLLSYCYGYLGQYYEKKKSFNNRIQLTRQAIFHAQNYPEILYLWQWQLGRLYQQLHDSDQAYKAFQNGIDTVSSIRHQFFHGFRLEQDLFNQKVRPVYLGLAETKLQNALRKEGNEKQTAIIDTLATIEN
ncbi:MAG: hypothetical protein OMM_13397 [Candidatus Magnetoglobus multicellularis str. Araruama]|uniref:Uncharacterized protein n=1 Tax=Candidatus Magnetoglobus multicellularis str. Araruama TaxID=890399 RepID=A0A1V1NTW8_9BACT|nr:MAG: hypothetical protein OMM_13397 [Candidatus Magnetoglobus multicellularis str. Araruama]